MKIPFNNEAPVKSRPVEQQYGNLNFEDGTEALNRGIASVGHAVDQVQAKNAGLAEQARVKADAISQANADAAYQRAETGALVGGPDRRGAIDNAFEGSGPAAAAAGDVKDVPGFLSTRGMKASELSAPVLEGLEKARQKIARDTFNNPEQRARWLARSQGFFENSRRRVETHSAEQFQVAARDALKGKLDASLQAIANDTNGAATQAIADDGAAAIRALQTTPEGGQAAVNEWQANVVKARVEALLSQGQVEHARGQFEVAKEALGTHRPAVERAIARAEEVEKLKSVDTEAETRAGEVFRAAVNPKTGWVDPARALADIDALPAGPVKKEARQLLEHRLVVAKQLKAQAVDNVYNNALSVVEKTNGNLSLVSPEDRQYLQNPANDPEAWHKLQRVADGYAEQARVRQRMRDGTAQERAEARRQQAERNLIAYRDFASKPSDEQLTFDTSVYRAQGVDDVGMSAFGPLKKSAKEKLEQGMHIHEERFVADVKKTTLLPATKAGKVDAKELEADLRIRFDRFVKDHNGKLPTAEEETKIASDAKLAQAKTGLAGLFGGKEPAYKAAARERAEAAKKAPEAPPAAPTATAEPAALKVLRWKVSPDKKRRAPVYEDGSTGPAEKVP